MNFSDLFKQTNLLCEFSPNGKYLANVSQFRVVIRDINSLEIANLFTCLDTINYIEVFNGFADFNLFYCYFYYYCDHFSGHQILSLFCVA
jgi:hypothetical protein